jgi:hypothetical protein
LLRAELDPHALDLIDRGLVGNLENEEELDYVAGTEQVPRRALARSLDYRLAVVGHPHLGRLV